MDKCHPDSHLILICELSLCTKFHIWSAFLSGWFLWGFLFLFIVIITWGNQSKLLNQLNDWLTVGLEFEENWQQNISLVQYSTVVTMKVYNILVRIPAQSGYTGTGVHLIQYRVYLIQYKDESYTIQGCILYNTGCILYNTGVHLIQYRGASYTIQGVSYTIQGCILYNTMGVSYTIQGCILYSTGCILYNTAPNDNKLDSLQIYTERAVEKWPRWNL